MMPLNSPARPAAVHSPTGTPGSGKQPPDAAQGDDFARALDRSRQAEPQDEPSQPVDGAAAKPRAGKARLGPKDDEPTLSAPLAEVLLAASQAPVAPAVSGLPAAAANPLAASRHGAATAAATATALSAAAAAPQELPAAPLAAAPMEGTAAQLASAGRSDAQLPTAASSLPGGAAVAGPAVGGSVAQAAQIAAQALPPAGAAQPAIAQSGTTPSVTSVAARREAGPDFTTDLRRAAGAGPAIASDNTQPAPSAPALQQDVVALDDSSLALPAAVPAAPNALSPAAPVSKPAEVSVAPAVGSNEWGAALGHQLVKLGRGSGQVAELNLNPAHLGPLKITLSVSENHAQVMFVSAHAAVRDAVEAALPQLRASFAENGISLGQTSVGAESRQSAPRDEPPAQSRDGRPTLPIGAASAEPSRADVPMALRVQGLGVDTFA